MTERKRHAPPTSRGGTELPNPTPKRDPGAIAREKATEAERRIAEAEAWMAERRSSVAEIEKKLKAKLDLGLAVTTERRTQISDVASMVGYKTVMVSRSDLVTGKPHSASTTVQHTSPDPDGLAWAIEDTDRTLIASMSLQREEEGYARLDPHHTGPGPVAEVEKMTPDGPPAFSGPGPTHGTITGGTFWDNTAHSHNIDGADGVFGKALSVALNEDFAWTDADMHVTMDQNGIFRLAPGPLVSAPEAKRPWYKRLIPFWN